MPRSDAVGIIKLLRLVPLRGTQPLSGGEHFEVML